MGAEGFEPPSETANKRAVSDSGGSNSVNNQASSGVSTGAVTPADPELSAMVAAWGGLAPAMRAAVLAMVRAATNCANGRRRTVPTCGLFTQSNCGPLTTPTTLASGSTWR